MTKTLLLLTAFVVSLPACAQNAPLRWGADAGAAPFVFRDPKNPREVIGFEVDLVNALGQRLKRTPDFKQNQWEGLIPGLKRNNYDVAINGIEITDDRRNEINFSIPYYAGAEQLSVRRETEGVQSLADLKGKTVGTLQFSLADRMLTAAGGITVRGYEAEPPMYEDLANGRLDAALMDWPVAVYYSKPNPKLKFVGAPIGHLEYGIGVRKEDGELLKQLNAALLEMIKSGELRRIYDKWGIWNQETEALFAKLTAQPQGYEDFTKSTTTKLTLREQVKRYWMFFTILLTQGAPMTVLISILGMALAVALGLVLALMNIYGARPLAWFARAYIEVMRGTPLLIQLFLIFYGLPTVEIKLTPLAAAVVGLGLNYAAYEAENYRAGIQSLPKGQMEAALSLGMTRAQALRHVIVPQALRLVIPPVTNDFIALFKDSSIVSVITMVELTKVYNQLASTYYDYIGIGLIAAAIYFLLGLPFVRLARWTEARLANDRKVAAAAKRRWFGVGAKPSVG